MTVRRGAVIARIQGSLIRTQQVSVTAIRSPWNRLHSDAVTERV